MAGKDDDAVATLRRAFARTALPEGFLSKLPWFAQLRGHAGYDALVDRWEAERTAARGPHPCAEVSSDISLDVASPRSPCLVHDDFGLRMMLV